ncbi:hypothetical protein EJ03DRAFT_34825 [Teratosphaeria nubilosa]|uniref:Uncharacterized protein n=1 Tax=Teratosphaeria nubilosa TaxID=161662 RepID=A0A6G1KVR1_9PEZI|nr:hypothetical protein EJ03DRAFT_34825 [Teratosphaeria nubilosa]
MFGKQRWSPSSRQITTRTSVALDEKPKQPSIEPALGLWRPQPRRVSAHCRIKKIRTRHEDLPPKVGPGTKHNQSIPSGNAKPDDSEITIPSVGNEVPRKEVNLIEHAFFNLKMVLEARKMLQAQRDMVERLTAELDRNHQDIADHDVRIRCAKRSRRSDHPLLDQLLRRRMQAQEAVEYHRAELQKAESRPDTGEVRFAQIESEAFSLLAAYLSTVTSLSLPVNATLLQNLEEKLSGARPTRQSANMWGRRDRPVSGNDAEENLTLGVPVPNKKFRSRKNPAFVIRF